jgi:choline dehydrogenase
MLAYARARSSTIFDPSGACMMAPSANPMAVVDHELRVHGLSSLRVADASIMPTVVSGNTNAACIMVGEKCAEMMLAAR